jgi:hypothetical protein
MFDNIETFICRQLISGLIARNNNAKLEVPPHAVTGSGRETIPAPRGTVALRREKK